MLSGGFCLLQKLSAFTDTGATHTAYLSLLAIFSLRACVELKRLISLECVMLINNRINPFNCELTATISSCKAIHFDIIFTDLEIRIS